MRNPAPLVICIGAVLFSGGCDSPRREAGQSVATYGSTRCGGPGPGWSAHGSEFGELMAHNTLAVGPAKLTWNGVALSAATLQSYLQEMRRLNPSVNLQLVFDERADCGLVKQTRALVTGKLGCHSTGQCVEYSGGEYRAEESRRAVN
jgi:hypothetical protein